MTQQTLPVSKAGDARTFRRFRLEVIAGTDAGAELTAVERVCSIGTEEGNDLRLSDPTVSRFHCEISIAGNRFRVRDLGSKNSTRIAGVWIADATVPSGAELTCGHSRVRIATTDLESAIEVAESPGFGPLVGGSEAMRQAFARLERAAASDATVLLEGETGTGKEGAAAGLHEGGRRAAGPMVVVDCGAIPPNLIESELFGHEAGAFTGAGGRRIGAFEEANGGTVILDEIGELALELQPKLLRALESQTIKRIGGRKPIDCDVRVIAATNRDLRSEVNDGRFRADLYYRLAVVRITLPPLRERAGDLPQLCHHLLDRLGASTEDLAALTSTEFIAGLARAAWPGNVRELRNHLEQCLVMKTASLPEPSPNGSPPAVDPEQPYDESRRLAIEAFERAYVEALLDRHGGNVSDAARTAGMNRAYLYRLIKRHRG